MAPQKTKAEIEQEIAQIELETRQIELESAKEANAEYKEKKAARLRANEQRLAQLRQDLSDKQAVIATCTHRQGGAPGRERQGKGPSALRVVILPDNRQLVMCGNCPMRVFSPYPADKSPIRRRGETDDQTKARVAAFHAAQAEFERLQEEATDQLTPEAAQPMHCGKTFSFSDKNGQPMVMPAPCDTYAGGLDNRRKKTAA